MTQQTLQTDEMVINMGPQHPSTHGVLHLLVTTDGEIVSDVDSDIGFLHRCAEKIGENITYQQFVPYTDRMDYLSGIGNELAFCLAVEELLELEVPERAHVIRVVMSEVQRIASHLLAVGVFGMDIGAFTPFLFALREREMVLDLIEYVSGARLLPNYVSIGGVQRDMDDVFIRKTIEFLDYLETMIPQYHELLSYNEIFLERTVNIGVISEELGLAYGLTGPNLRASGPGLDRRKAHPYCGYEKYDFDVQVGSDEVGVLGDCWNRYMVRFREIEESAKIVRQAIDSLPEGDFRIETKKTWKPDPGEAYGVVEQARGEMGFYVISDGDTNPLRVSVRSPSFCNLSILPELSNGVMLADLVAIVGSLDIVLGEIDR